MGAGTYTTNYLGEIIIGSYETATEPPTAGDNECARYLDDNGDVPYTHGTNNAGWVVHADYRGDVYYLPNGGKKTITKLNKTIPPGHVTHQAPSQYHTENDGTDWIYTENAQHCEDRCNEVDALRVTKENEYFTYNGNDWQVDRSSQNLINARSTYALVNKSNPTLAPWTGSKTDWSPVSNVDQTFTADEFLEFAVAVDNHIDAIFAKCKEHKTALRLLTDYTAVDTYDITTGW